MAEPHVVQSGSTSLASTGTTISLTWAAATTTDSRLLAFVSLTDNGTAHTVTPPAGFTLMTDPGKVTRQAAGNDQVSIACYQKVGAASQSGAKAFTWVGACYASIVWVEVAGDDPTVTVNDGFGSNSGSAQTFSTGSSSATTVDNALVFAFFGAGNNHAQQNPLPAGYTILQQVATSSTAATAKSSVALTNLRVTTTGVQAATIDILGGFSHSYAAMIVSIPAVTGGTPPVTDFDDGKAHLACTQDYFGTIDTLAHAQTLATTRNVVVGWMRIAGDSFTTNNFGTFADDMVTAASGASNPLLLLGYMKSMVKNNADPSTMPEAFYAHTCAGARITSGSASLPTMQSQTIAAPAFSDARGFTATKWASWKAQDVGFAVSHFNATYTAACNGVMLDTLGNASFKSACNAGVPYTRPQWVGDVVRTGLVDVVTAANPTLTIYGNGLGGPGEFYGPNNATQISSDGLCDHVSVGIAESWIRGNYDRWGVWPVNDPTQARNDCWQNCVQMLIDADLNHNCGVWVIVNIANSTPGRPPQNWVDYTTAQVNQWKRFSYCTFMLGQRGRSLYEFVSVKTTKPWNETHSYWTQDLGAPASAETAVSAMRLASGAYQRDYASGTVWVNPTSASISFAASQAYTNPDTGTSIGAGAQIHLNANDGLLLLHDASSPTDTDSPSITITSPTSGQVFASGDTVVLDATVTDNDGVASVSAELDGGAALACTPLPANVYEKSFGAVQPGDHSITVFATDSFPVTPLSSQKAVAFTVSEPPPPNTPPNVVITGPADVVVLPATAVAECSALDSDGISGVHVSLDFGTPVAMTPASAVAPGGTFTLDLGVLTEGNHRVDITATDANASPLGTTVSRSFLVTTASTDDGGHHGGEQGGGPLTISTDIGIIELRIKERGLG